VLDFEHDAFVRLVGAGSGFGDDTIEAGAFEPAKPVERDVTIAGCRCDVDGRGCGGEQRFKLGAALFEGLAAQVAPAFAEKVEEDNRGWRLLGEKLHPRGRGMDAELEGVEIEMAVVRNNELAVENALAGKLGAQRVQELRKIAVEGFLVAALDEDFVAVFEDEGAEAIPLGLEEPVTGGGDLIDAFGEHGEDGRINRQVHGFFQRVRGEPDAYRSWGRLILFTDLWPLDF